MKQISIDIFNELDSQLWSESANVFRYELWRELKGDLDSELWGDLWRELKGHIWKK